MRFPDRLIPLVRWAVPAAALGFLIWNNAGQLRHIVHVSGISEEKPAVDSSSTTGYVLDQRNRILPEHDRRSDQWVMQTQAMLADGAWRLRHFEADNAPFGREVRDPSASRWWLGLLAQVDHLISGDPVGLSAERASLYAGPLLLLILSVGSTLFVARTFGPLGAALNAAGLVALFPWAGAFLPGRLTDNGLALGCAYGTILLLTAARAPLTDAETRAEEDGGRRPRETGKAPLVVLAGAAGGLGLWIQPGILLPVLAAITLAAMACTLFLRRRVEAANVAAEPGIPWNWWAAGGAATLVIVYLLDKAPDRLTWWPAGGIHPVHAVGWLGLGTVLACLEDRSREGSRPAVRRRTISLALAALLTVATITVAVVRPGSSGPVDAISAWRLSDLPDSPIQPDLVNWLSAAGFHLPFWATVLPLLGLLPAIWILLEKTAGARRRETTAFLIASAFLLAGFAVFQLRLWAVVDAVILPLFIVTAASSTRPVRVRTGDWLWLCGFLLILWPGAALLVRESAGGSANTLTPDEAESVVVRHLAGAIARGSSREGCVVLSTPRLTESLGYYGNLQGIGTLHPDNEEGMDAAVRMASATSPMEALALLNKRGVTHVVIPSWDSALSDFARLGSGSPTGTFAALLRRWEVPDWINPVVYRMPRLPGWEEETVLVFSIVDDQDPADAAGRLAEYFIETGRVDRAMALREPLRNYPASLGALAALAQVEMARGNAEAFGEVMAMVVPYTVGGADRFMAFDRRVSLAIVLAQARQLELAKAQIEICLGQIDESTLRSLTPSSLYRFILVCRMTGQQITDPELRDLAVRLIPPELRERL